MLFDLSASLTQDFSLGVKANAHHPPIGNYAYPLNGYGVADAELKNCLNKITILGKVR